MSVRRAMTLLELLVALAIMVAIVGLTSALWAQTSGWAADDSLHRSTLRLEHVRSLFERQWDERRPGVRLDDPDGPAQRLAGDTFEFVTGVPVLFPDAAMVRASYRIEETEDSTLTAPRRRLVYVERRVVTPTHSDARRTDSTGRPMVRQTVLLDDCAALAWSEYAPVPVRDAFGRGESAATPTYEWGEPAERETTGARTDASRADATDDDDQSPEAAAGPIALRLEGAFQETPFQWTVALGPSR